MNRIIRIGNTEEKYMLRPDELLYLETVKGQEKMEAHLLNGSVYTLPSTLTALSETIDDATRNTTYEGVILQIGRSLLLNHNYLKEAIEGTVLLEATIGDKTVCRGALWASAAKYSPVMERRGRRSLQNVSCNKMPEISKKACSKLASLIDQSKWKLKQYQEDNHPEGYDVWSSGSPGGGCIGFIMRKFTPKKRDGRFYEIDDDDLLILGL